MMNAAANHHHLPPAGQDDAGPDLLDHSSDHSSESDAAEWAPGGKGRLEPGVLSLTCDGPVLVTCNTLGCTLISDFSKASLPARWWALGSDDAAAVAGAAARGGAGAGGEGEEGSDDGNEGLAGKFWAQLEI